MGYRPASAESAKASLRRRRPAPPPRPPEAAPPRGAAPRSAKSPKAARALRRREGFGYAIRRPRETGNSRARCPSPRPPRSRALSERTSRSARRAMCHPATIRCRIHTRPLRFGERPRTHPGWWDLSSSWRGRSGRAGRNSPIPPSAPARAGSRNKRPSPTSPPTPAERQ